MSEAYDDAILIKGEWLSAADIIDLQTRLDAAEAEVDRATGYNGALSEFMEGLIALMKTWNDRHPAEDALNTERDKQQDEGPTYPDDFTMDQY